MAIYYIKFSVYDLGQRGAAVFADPVPVMDWVIPPYSKS